MNRLKGYIFYCIGPIDDVSKQEAMQWRNDLKPFLWSLNAGVIDPCDKPIEGLNSEIESLDYRQTLKKNKNYGLLSSLVKENIRHPDLRFCDICHASIVNLDLSVRLCGTWEEINTCNWAKKPIIIRCPQGKDAIPDWMFAKLPHQLFFEKWSEVKSYLRHVNECPSTPETYGRWVFMDMDKVWPKKKKCAMGLYDEG